MNNVEVTKKELEEIVKQYKEMITIQKNFIKSIGAESRFDEFAKEIQKDRQTILGNAEVLRAKEMEKHIAYDKFWENLNIAYREEPQLEGMKAGLEDLQKSLPPKKSR